MCSITNVSVKYLEKFNSRKLVLGQCGHIPPIVRVKLTTPGNPDLRLNPCKCEGGEGKGVQPHYKTEVWPLQPRLLSRTISPSRGQTSSPPGIGNTMTRGLGGIKEGQRQKERQRSSLLFGGKNLFHS